LAKFDLKEYARKGAEARVAELQAELSSIFRAFPDLRAGRPGRGAGAPRRTAAAAAAPARRRRSRMSAAQRKAVSARMKKYWAERRGKAAK
jgi:hypothetical protein